MWKKSCLAVILPCLALLVLAACQDGGGGSSKERETSQFTYNGQSYPLTRAWVFDYGQNTGPGESGYNLDFYAASDGLDAFTGTGTGHGVYLELTSPLEGQYATGSYEWTYGDYQSNGLTSAQVLINYNLDTDVGTAIAPVYGVVIINQTGTIYDISFSLTTEDETVITGRYFGTAGKHSRSD